MNRFDNYTTDFLSENKEVALEKIGFIKIQGSFSPEDAHAASVEFTCNKKIPMSQELIIYIAQKSGKNKNLIASDLESHFAQVREFLNIGKSYEIPSVGFIKANKTGIYEFLPYSDINKPAKQTTQQTAKQRQPNNKRSAVQLITFLIVLAILVGLGWQAYQFFSKPQTNSNTDTLNNKADTGAIPQDTVKNMDTTDQVAQQLFAYSDTDIVNVKYIYETTASILRAQTRTDQLKNFGNNSGYDSFINNNTKFYSLYILKPTKIADTLTVKDSISKFLMRDVTLKIIPTHS